MWAAVTLCQVEWANNDLGPCRADTVRKEQGQPLWASIQGSQTQRERERQNERTVH